MWMCSKDVLDSVEQQSSNQAFQEASPMKAEQAVNNAPMGQSTFVDFDS